jgi:hypothetical protein
VGVVVLRSLSIEATARLWSSRDGLVASAPDRGGSFALFAAGARACWALTTRIEIAPCLGFEIARIGASGFGAAKVADADAVTWGPEADLTGRFPLVGPVALRVGIGAVAPISRRSFVIQSTGIVHEPGAVALRGFLGPEVHF